MTMLWTTSYKGPLAPVDQYQNPLISMPDQQSKIYSQWNHMDKPNEDCSANLFKVWMTRQISFGLLESACPKTYLIKVHIEQ